MKKIENITRRIASTLIDFFVIYFLFFFLGTFFAKMQIVMSDTIILLKYAIIFILYFSIIEKNHHRSIGKFVCNLKIIRDDNQQLTYKLTFIRSIIFFIESILLFIPCLTALFNKKHKTLHDIICKTQIVKYN